VPTPSSPLKPAKMAALSGVLFVLAVVAVACGGSSNNSSTPAPTPTPTATPTATPIPHQLTLCPQNFALCAASTCTETGKTITVNNGKTYPAVTCTCPVLQGPAIADVTQGNMQGSCDSPEGGVWSLYQIDSDIPQASATPAWAEAPAPVNICPAAGKFGQCWNFACTLGEIVNNVQLATCTCPEEVALSGYVTQAQNACDDIPVAGAVAIDPNSVP
jgi:hypothetical protein